MGHIVKFSTLTEIKKDKTILDVAEDIGVKIKSSCDGKGKCGKCMVKAVGALSEMTKTEKKMLNEKKIEAGYRLACEATIIGDVEVLFEV